MFVGRGSVLAQIHKAAAQDHATFELRGSPGSGKTAIVRHLEEEAQAFRPIVVNLEEFDPGHSGEVGQSASVGAVQGSFRQFAEVLAGLVRGACTVEVAERFEHEVTEAYNSEVAGRRVFSLEQAMLETQGALTPRDLADAWRASATAVADCFVAHWNADAEGRCRLLLLDNGDVVADQELGVWLGALLPRLERTAVVVTRQPGGPLPALAGSVGDAFVALDVANFSEEEVREYLEEKAPGRVPGDVVGKVHRITGGHPGTVAVVHDLLWGPGVGGEANAEEVLRGLPDQASERVALLVERLVERLGDPAMSRALSAAAVPRRFDASLLKALLVDATLQDDDVKRVFEAFGHFPFTEDVTPPDADLPERSLLRVHPYVRDGLLDRTLRLDRDRFNALHERAAEYHNQLLVGEGATSASLPYGEAFVYEDPAWQRSKREWLYHRGHAWHDEARRRAVVESARVFLEAFWWWGNYVHFDFCDQLVADLGHMAERHGVRTEGSTWSDLDVLHQALQSFLQAYPPRSAKRKDAAWGTVFDALLQVQDACGLSHRGKEKSDEDRKVAALLDVFLAHTWRYRAGEKPQADEYYRRAAAGFERLEEDWSAAWVHFERAELRFERGQLDDDLSGLWHQAASIVQPPPEAEADPDAEGGGGSDEPDEELTANLHRLRGDVCWRGGDVVRAATWYRRAVLHAYLFHVVGGPPDEYTLQFYVDVRARALNRLLELWTGGRQDEALDCAEALARVRAETSFDEGAASRAELEARLADGRPVTLSEALFPAGPEVSDLGKRTSPFMTEHRRRAEALARDTAAMDLHDPRWP